MWVLYKIINLMLVVLLRFTFLMHRNFGRHLGLNKNTKVNKNDLSEQQIKTALRPFTFNYIDVDDDGKRLKVPKELRKKITILKPDNGQGAVLLKQEDYTNCVETLLAGRNKFKRIHKVM